MTSPLTDADGNPLLTVTQALEYINARRDVPIQLRTLTSYMPRRQPDGSWGGGRAGMPPPDAEIPRGERPVKVYSTATLDRWLAQRPGKGNRTPRTPST